MNFIFIVFLMCFVILMILSLRNLARLLLQDKIASSKSQDLSLMSYKEKSKLILRLVVSGFFLRHTIANDYLPRDDKKHMHSYKSLLGNDVAITTFKRLKGDRKWTT